MITTPILSIADLSVSIDHKRVLSHVFLDIYAGHTYGVIGPNGAGKSTLFKAILGLIDIKAGQILVHGKPLKSLRSAVAYVPQKDEVDWQFPATVHDIVLQGRYSHKKILQRLNSDDHQIAEKAMSDLDISHLRDRQIGALSGGQQQRVFLARALCQQPEIYLLDEPLAGVDVVTEEKMVGKLQALAAEGKTVMVIHHDLSTVRTYFDSVILLNQRLIAYGNVNEVFTEENISLTYQAQLSILHKTGLLDRQV